MVSFKSILSLVFARYVVKKNNRWKNNAVEHQNKIMHLLVSNAKNTLFGKDHFFKKISNRFSVSFHRLPHNTHHLLNHLSNCFFLKFFDKTFYKLFKTNNQVMSDHVSRVTSFVHFYPALNDGELFEAEQCVL